MSNKIMKQVLLVIVTTLCLNFLKSNAQLSDTLQSKIYPKVSSDLLLKKSKNQKTTAWILLGAGAGLGIAGLVVGEGAVNRVGRDPFDKTFSTTATSGALALAGGASMLASIPFFIASGSNRRKASVMLKNESVSISQQLHSCKRLISLVINVNL